MRERNTGLLKWHSTYIIFSIRLGHEGPWNIWASKTYSMLVCHQVLLWHQLAPVLFHTDIFLSATAKPIYSF